MKRIETVQPRILQSLGSLDNEESLACQITSPLNNKLGCFENKIKEIAVEKTYLFVEWGSYLASQRLPFL